ncbi:MAG: Mut7-C RNAse domain-containing protein [Nitrososphaeria archaeon]|nr:Mut7-C RNAse domain-containing protein [Nitrososphaeria archaeon]
MREEERLSNIKFIIDCMHGKLARKMRIYGFDTKYDIALDDNKIIEIAKNEGRTIITSDEELINRARAENLQVIRVPLDNDLPRMIKIFTVLKILPEIDPKRSRCPNCNSTLTIVDKKEVQNVPEKVLKRKKIFYKCSRCGKVYWHGSHWKKIREFEKTLKKRLKKLKEGEEN